jgi:hypothetical protein
MTGGGLNYSPRPAVYDVLSVDRNDRTVQLRACVAGFETADKDIDLAGSQTREQACQADGRTGNVYVDEAIFDVSTLKAGDKIRVDFVVPEATNNGLRAASVWRER